MAEYKFEEKIGNPVPTARRITEVMESKNVSIRALGIRLEFIDENAINRESLRQILKGIRPCRPSEIKLIAEGLKVSEERLKQTDTMTLVRDIRNSIERKDDLPRAKKLCEYYVSVALGYSEKCDALHYLARVNADLGDYDSAHTQWLDAYEHAKVVAEKFGVADRLYAVLINLMMSHTHRKEFSNLAEILTKAEEIFQYDYEKMGAIYHSKAMVAEQFKNADKTREYLYQSLTAFQQTGIANHIGRAQVNAGYFEFKNKNYIQAKALFEDAIQNLANDKVILPIATKELAKTLIKLGELENAASLVEGSYHLVKENQVLMGKFDLLLALAKNDISYAEKNTMKAGVGKTVRALACRILINHYNKLSDSSALMKYYRIEEKILETSDILDKEEF